MSDQESISDWHGRPMDDYDLRAVFSDAEPEFRSVYDPSVREVPFLLEDIEVEKSILWDPGDSGEPDFYALAKLKNGRWAALEAWHDYTGWD